MKLRFKDPINRYKAGASNRGKKLSVATITAMHGNRSRESYIRVHSVETKSKIGDKSKSKFTPEYNAKFKTKMIELGIWVDDKDRNPYQVYYTKSNWIEKMFDRFDPELLNPGIFSANNSKGVVRDHKYSRSSGWKNKVFFEILRHPENCAIILHADNIRKRYTNPDSITLDQLFQKIESYTGVWSEQRLCLDKIKAYRDGLRYTP